jgi:hypothetical protein
MNPHVLFVSALAVTFMVGCATPDDKESPELFETGSQTGTHIDKPGLPPKTMDQYSIERAFRNSSTSMPGAPPGGN